MSETSVVAGVEVPQDVMAFAIEQKVDGYLGAVVEAARRRFPGAKVGLQLYEDHEIEGQFQIQVDALDAPLSVEESLQATDDYHLDLFAAVIVEVNWRSAVSRAYYSNAKARERLDWQPRPNRALLHDRHANRTEVIVPFVHSGQS